MITTITILLAVWAWTRAIGGGWLLPKERQHTITLRWGIGFLLYLVHIIAAFQEHYQWSHRVALEKTAQQTKEVLGWDSGIGLYVNYLFGLALLIDLVVQFKMGPWHRGRNWINGFVIFMVINGAIIFGTWQSRIVGAISISALVLVWWIRLRRKS